MAKAKAKEARARIKINKLLEKAGWRFFDAPEGKANICLEVNTSLTEHVLSELGEDFEKTKKGLIDFLLLDDKHFPLAVLEAKREGKNPLDGKEQARKYAQSQNVRFVILSNGNLHYFWDVETGNPYIITAFPTHESLNHKQSFKPNPANLAKEHVSRDYIAITQKPDYQSDPRWLNKSQQNEFIKDNKLRFLREYQWRAVRALQEAAKNGKGACPIDISSEVGGTAK